MPVFDDIWQSVPADRPLGERSLAFALEALATLEANGRLRVLDLGCGDGRVAARLAAAGADVTGVDASQEALERASRANPELEFTSPNADGTLPLADNSFDAVVCINVLEHVADTQALVSEARRVLAPGGRLVVVVPWHGRLKNALGSFERHHDPLQPVLRFYSRRSLRMMLEELGFELVRLKGVGGVPFARETLLAEAKRSSLSA
jgi:ubiquinone/menaquinone biosynthesis C-methylase UbiE